MGNKRVLEGRTWNQILLGMKYERLRSGYFAKIGEMDRYATCLELSKQYERQLKKDDTLQVIGGWLHQLVSKSVKQVQRGSTSQSQLEYNNIRSYSECKTRAYILDKNEPPTKDTKDSYYRRDYHGFPLVETCTFRLSKPLDCFLRSLAATEGRDVAQIVRRMVHQQAEKEGYDVGNLFF